LKESSMDVEQSYFAVSWFFSSWVRLMEYHTRKMEVIDSVQLGPKRLIISPPTDAGIPLLIRANSSGQTDLLCFSKRLQRVADEYGKRHRIKSLATSVELFFQIPAPDESLSAIYANCLFDFCTEEDFDMMLREIWRVLKPGGILFAVYMAPASGFGSRLWTWIFDRLTCMSIRCNPVTISAHLSRNGFIIQKEMFVQRFGFPIIYSVSERPIPVI
jgi:SAM-dependent methyltransferase